MTKWPSTASDLGDALWRVHVALVEIRAAASGGDPSVRWALDGLSHALNDLAAKGADAFVARLGTEPIFRRATKAVPPERSVLAAFEGVAFARALAWVTHDLSVRAADVRDLAKAMDELEYLPCEFLRLGGAAIVKIADYGEPPHVRGLAEQYRLNLSEFLNPTPSAADPAASWPVAGCHHGPCDPPVLNPPAFPDLNPPGPDLTPAR